MVHVFCVHFFLLPNLLLQYKLHFIFYCFFFSTCYIRLGILYLFKRNVNYLLDLYLCDVHFYIVWCDFGKKFIPMAVDLCRLITSWFFFNYADACYPRLENLHRSVVQLSERMACLWWSSPETPSTSHHYRTEGFKGGLQFTPPSCREVAGSWVAMCGFVSVPGYRRNDREAYRVDMFGALGTESGYSAGIIRTHTDEYFSIFYWIKPISNCI